MSHTKTDIKLCHEISITEHFRFNNVYELAQVLPLHIFALTVKIKPYVVYIWAIDRLVDLTHLITDPKLATLFINQVYHELIFIVSLSLFEMELGGL